MARMPKAFLWPWDSALEGGTKFKPEKPLTGFDRILSLKFSLKEIVTGEWGIIMRNSPEIMDIIRQGFQVLYRKTPKSWI
jgi:hypothetical protein